MGAFFFEGTKVAKKPNQSADAPASTTEARALIDLPEFGAKCGALVHVPADRAQGMAEAGEIDTHPEAVAYAKG